MPFCNWCQMESESGDVCAWCKRPMQARSVYGSFDYVREGEALTASDRYVPIIGGCVMLAFIVGLGYALTTVQTKPKGPVTSETVAEMKSPTPVVSGTTYVVSRPTPSGVNAQGSKGTPFPEPNRTNYSGQNQGLSNANRATQAVADESGGDSGAGLTVSAGRFRVAKTSEGRYILYGEADLENSGRDSIRNSRFVLMVEDEPVLLSVYSGDIYRPKYEVSPEIPAGRSTVFLINTEVSPKILESGRRSLTVDGKNANGPIQGAVGLD